MRLRFLCFVSLLFFTPIFLKAQTTVNGSFMFGGKNRTYSFYVPASYNASTPVPLVLGLHGTSSSGAEFAEYRDFRPIADTANFIMVHPDGSTLLGVRFWNYGNVFGSTVDDVGFLEALIDTISAHYSINHNRVYCTGMSNGSFMAYYLACESDRFAAIGTVAGSMSTNMYADCNPSRPTPSIHIHGTDDDINPYEGTSNMVGIDAVNRFWVDQNNCDTVPIVSPLPDIIISDDATATQYLYANGTDGNTVELFKVSGGGHSWPGRPMPNSSEVTCMDFDACVEIWRFFSQYEKATSSVENYSTVDLNVWPNPSAGLVYVESPKTVSSVSVYDLHGKLMENITNGNIQQIDLSQLNAGIYLVRVSGDNFSIFKKLILLR